jgi:hypothetical protein
MPPGTGFPFRRFLRLAELRWRYSNPPPHTSRGHVMSCQSQHRSCLMTDDQSASLSWCQAPISDSRPIFFISLIIFKQLRIC